MSAINQNRGSMVKTVDKKVHRFVQNRKSVWKKQYRLAQNGTKMLFLCQYSTPAAPRVAFFIFPEISYRLFSCLLRLQSNDHNGYTYQ